MRKRSAARELVLKILYQKDITSSGFKGISGFAQTVSDSGLESEDVEINDYARRLFEFVGDKHHQIDEALERISDNWRLDRMAVVDRNILRLGACEILYFDDIPAKVAINESIELAKKFGDDESPKFINGILDKIARECGKAAEQ